MGRRARFFSWISPCAGPWGYRHGGKGRRGGGLPPPLSPTLQPTYSSSPPPRTRLRRSSSAPFRGAWAVPGRISGKQPYPGRSRWAAVPGSSPGYPHVLDRGISPRGEGPTGRGNSFPLPCLSRSNHLTSRRSRLRRLFCEDTRTYFRYPRPGTRALPGGSPWETVLDAGSDLLR